MTHDTSALINKHPANRQKKVFGFTDTPHYHEWIVSRIHPFFGKNILDINSGSGGHLAYILPRVEKVTSIDASVKAIERLNQRYKNFIQYRAVRADFQQSPQPAWMKVSGFDTLVCMDLLEHFSDDLAVLRQLNVLLPAGEGVLIMKVPAHPGLYGSLDRNAGHYRRYKKSELATKLEQTGFKILHIEYFSRLSALFWWLNGRIFGRRLNSRTVLAQVKIFDRLLVPVLKFLESLLPLPFGQSLLIAAVKQREDYWTQ